MTKPKLICLTSVLNEAWILDRFIRCASLWADHIIIGDQGSTDGSVEIAKRYDKVIFVDNPRMDEMNEGQYRSPLFDKAREIEGPKILITLDADEIMTPNFDSPEWNTVQNAKPGTILSFPIHNLLPDGTYWAFGDCYTGYVDDGEPFRKGVIHAIRTIAPAGHSVLKCHDICVLHYKFMDWERMAERNRWYQCFEMVHGLSYPISIFRRYHQIDSIPKEQFRPWSQMWIDGYAEHGIEITSVLHVNTPMWTGQVVNYMSQYGARFFRHLNIWDVNWNEIADSLGVPHEKSFKDPRRKWEKVVNRWLISTQKKQNKTSVHLMDKILKLIYR